MLVRDCLQSISLMRIVTIKAKNDGFVIDTVCESMRNECILKPLLAELAVCPPVRRRRNAGK